MSCVGSHAYGERVRAREEEEGAGKREKDGDGEREGLGGKGTRRTAAHLAIWTAILQDSSGTLRSIGVRVRQPS